MKHCEDWLNKEIRPHQACPKELPYTAAFEEIVNGVRKEAWKAAIEYMIHRGMYYYGNDFLTDMHELSTEMRIEVGELNEHGKVISKK